MSAFIRKSRRVPPSNWAPARSSTSSLAVSAVTPLHGASTISASVTASPSGAVACSNPASAARTISHSRRFPISPSRVMLLPANATGRKTSSIRKSRSRRKVRFAYPRVPASVSNRAANASKNLRFEKNVWSDFVRIEAASQRAPSPRVITASIALVILVWALNFIAVKIGLLYLPPFGLASFRVVLAGAVMVPTYLFCSRLPAFSEAANARSRGFSARDLWTFLYLGFFGVRAWNFRAFRLAGRRCNYLDGLHRLRDLRHIGQACGREIRHFNYDRLQPFCRRGHCPAPGNLPSRASIRRRQLAASLASMGRLGVHGGVQFGARLRFLLLAASLSRSISIECLHLSSARVGNHPWNCLPRRERLLGTSSGWRSRARRRLLD